MDNFDTKLETITDVGKTLAAVIFSEIGGDIKKFSSVPKLVAYAGLYPKSRQSGESKSDGHMSKRGSPYLRRAVWLAATVAAHLTLPFPLSPEETLRRKRPFDCHWACLS